MSTVLECEIVKNRNEILSTHHLELVHWALVNLVRRLLATVLLPVYHVKCSLVFICLDSKSQEGEHCGYTTNHQECQH